MQGSFSVYNIIFKIPTLLVRIFNYPVLKHLNQSL